MTPKKVVSMIVVIAGLLLIALLLQASGGKQGSSLQANPSITNDSSAPAANIQEIQSDLLGAETDAQFATSRLAILRGPKPTQAQIAAAQAQAATSKQALATADLAAYDSSKDAVHKTDPFLDVTAEIQTTHQDMLSILAAWKGDIDSGTPPTNDDVSQYLSSIQQDLNNLLGLVDNLTPGPDLTQTQIDAYKQDVHDAIGDINSTINNLTTAETQAQNDQDTADTAQSIGDPNAIQDQTNTVVQDQSTVNDLQNQLNQANSDTNTDSNPSPVETVIPNDDSSNDSSDNSIIRINPEFDPSKPQLIQN